MARRLSRLMARRLVPDLTRRIPVTALGFHILIGTFSSLGRQIAENPSPAGGPSAGDPIDVASGLPVITKTDIVLGGARGRVAITRIFRGRQPMPARLASDQSQLRLSAQHFETSWRTD